MAISNDQVNAAQVAKVFQFIVYTGRQSDNLTLADMSLRAQYDQALVVDGNVSSQLNDVEIVATIAAIEEHFPGTVQRLTEIADWLNPLNPDGYRPQ